jgi:Cu(I)/Ag(I) efflux system membrane protein CusA/SilA
LAAVFSVLCGNSPSVKDRVGATQEGAVERVRPKMMTVVAIMAGLLPIMWSTGTGSEIMQRIAVPMIGGMISSTLLTLIVVPAIYGLVRGFRLPNEDRFVTPPPPSTAGGPVDRRSKVLEPAG